MQIHELSRSAVNLQEAFLDYVKAAITKDPNLRNLPKTPQGLAQRAQYIANNTAIDRMAQSAKKIWDQRVLQLQRTNQNRPIDSQRYANELRTFTIKNLLNNRTPDQLINGQQIDQIIQKISNPLTQSSPAAVAQLFNQLVDQAAVAAVSFEDPAQPAPARATPAPAATAAPPAAGAAPPAPPPPAQPSAAVGQQNLAMRVAGRDIKSMAKTAGIDLDRLKLLGSMMQGANNIRITNRTGNDQLDSLLELLGYKLS